MNDILLAQYVEPTVQGKTISNVASVKAFLDGFSGSRAHMDVRKKKKDYITTNGLSIVLTVADSILDNLDVLFPGKDICNFTRITQVSKCKIFKL